MMTFVRKQLTDADAPESLYHTAGMYQLANIKGRPKQKTHVWFVGCALHGTALFFV